MPQLMDFSSNTISAADKVLKRLMVLRRHNVVGIFLLYKGISYFKKMAINGDDRYLVKLISLLPNSYPQLFSKDCRVAHRFVSNNNIRTGNMISFLRNAVRDMEGGLMVLKKCQLM